jgi:hypothetical protein
VDKWALYAWKMFALGICLCAKALPLKHNKLLRLRQVVSQLVKAHR